MQLMICPFPRTKSIQDEGERESVDCGHREVRPMQSGRACASEVQNCPEQPRLFALVMVRPRYKPSLVFMLRTVLSMVMFSMGIQFFGLKTTSHGKSDHKNEFFRSGLPCEVVLRP